MVMAHSSLTPPSRWSTRTLAALAAVLVAVSAIAITLFLAPGIQSTVSTPGSGVAQPTAPTSVGSVPSPVPSAASSDIGQSLTLTPATPEPPVPTAQSSAPTQ